MSSGRWSFSISIQLPRPLNNWDKLTPDVIISWVRKEDVLMIRVEGNTKSEGRSKTMAVSVVLSNVLCIKDTHHPHGALLMAISRHNVRCVAAKSAANQRNGMESWDIFSPNEVTTGIPRTVKMECILSATYWLVSNISWRVRGWDGSSSCLQFFPSSYSVWISLLTSNFDRTYRALSPVPKGGTTSQREITKETEYHTHTRQNQHYRPIHFLSSLG